MLTPTDAVHTSDFLGERAAGFWHRDDELKINFSISFTQEGGEWMTAGVMNTHQSAWTTEM